MHYSEISTYLDHLMAGRGQEAGNFLTKLSEALEAGQGYVLITLDPDGLKITAAVVPGSASETIRAKKALRTLRRQIISGRANGPTS